MKSKHLYYLGIGLLSFFLCYNAAYINGDDIFHLSGSHSKEMYLPYEIPSWIPNRVLDMWGRGFVTLLVNQGYYFLSGFVQNPLEISFKLVSAVSYAVLIVLAQKTIVDIIPIKRLVGRTEKFLLHVLVITSLLCLLPYLNQVHLICYQLPSLLAFYVMVNLQANRDPKMNPGLAILLIYILAFSLESISLILLVFSFICLLRIYLRTKRSSKSSSLWNNSAFLILAFSIIVNSISVFITAMFSGRANGLGEGLSLARVSAKYHLALFGALVFLGFVSFILRTKKVFCYNDSMRLRRLILISLGSLLVVYLVSVTSYNFFSPSVYPWGDLFLIGKLAFFTTVLTLIVKFYLTRKIMHYVFTILLFITTSGLVVQSLRFYDEQSKMTKSVWEVFERIQASKGGDLVITDFNSNNIEYHLMPFPNDSQRLPNIFNQLYQIVFKKFLSAENTVNFIYN